ncbi:MAG: sensor histidine kinase KdpD [Actinobacteria bacterium]|nr:sensor histidine kinase KdpD [Actinomycetota bacterium]
MEAGKRPSPEELLARIERAARGKLTIFLGPVAGVGKTFAMLEAAQERLAEGVDLVIGWVETHGRRETEALLEGLPRIPGRDLEYRGKTFKEMDIDAILKRHTSLVLVDELAHTNIPGSRHARRFQDVEELLAAGINVYTTLNIQHVESLNDIVTQITQIPVRETVPDKLLEQADEIRLIDISADELIKRLQEGKVYIPEQATRAIEKFFRPGNINALRELTLRYAAQEVDRQLDRYREEHAIAGPWPVREAVVAALSPSPFSAQVARSAARLAAGLRAPWIATYVEIPGQHMSQAASDQLSRNLRLAEELGAQVIAITGNNVAEEILALARRKNVTQIVIGQPLHKPISVLWRISVVDQVIRGSQGMSVYVIPGAAKSREAARRGMARSVVVERKIDIRPYVETFLIIAVLTVITKLAQPYVPSLFDITNMALFYLLPVLYIAARYGRSPAVFVSIVAVLAFNFAFIPPVFTFVVADLRYLVVFAVFLIDALITGTLAGRLREQAERARRREERTAILYALSRQMAAETDMKKLLDTVVKAVYDALGTSAVIYMPDNTGSLKILAATPGAEKLDDERERAVAYWVFENGQFAGKGSETLAGAEGLYVPLKSEQTKLGALGILPVEPERMALPAQRRLLEGFAGLASLAIMRLRLTEEARLASSVVESERLRTALFNSVSHDLRTPLASITGAITSLEEEGVYDVEARQALVSSIKDGALRMNHMIGNLLDTARLESGMLKPNKDWCDIQDMIGVALRKVGDALKNRPIRIDIPAELPLVRADFSLIEQVIVNLLYNAAKYSPAGSQISVAARKADETIQVSIADRGPGIAEEDRDRVFDKFYRLYSPEHVSGTGLGLSICKGLIEVHGGRIWVDAAPEGGSVFTFTLPIEKQPTIKEPVVKEGVDRAC